LNEITNLLLVGDVNRRGKRFNSGSLPYFKRRGVNLRPVAGAHGNQRPLAS
jgi:hypothetical protein